MKDARDTSPTSLRREILRMTSQWLWRAMSWTFAWEDQIRSRNRSSMHLQIPTPPSHSDGSETHAEPEAEVSTSAGTDMEIGVSDRRVRSREERDPPRHHLDASSDRELTEEPRGKMQRRAETSESVVPCHSSEASSSELQQMSTAAASDNPTST